MKKFFIILIILLILGGSAYAGYAFLFREKGENYDFIVVQRKMIIHEVNVSGKVVPAENIDLAFEKSGKITKIFAKVGDRVKQGSLLASLDSSDLFSDLRKSEAGIDSAKAVLKQYEASLDSQKAMLAEIKKGTREEEIKVQEAEVKSAEVALNETKNNLKDKLEDAYTKADDAVRNKSDQVFSNSRANPQFLYSIDSQLKNDIESKRIIVEKNFFSWETDLNSFSDSSDFTLYIAIFDKNLLDIKTLLFKLSLAINYLYPSSDLSQTKIDTYKSDISAARTSVNLAISNIKTAEEKFNNAKSSLALSENELKLKKAPVIPEKIASEEAKVRQVEANIESQMAKIKEAESEYQNLKIQIGKMSIYSPINGVVAKKNADIYEIVSANSAVFSLISDSGLKIEANLPEADIAKVKILSEAELIFDSLDRDLSFKAKLILIDPAETVIDGVSTYKTTFHFLTIDPRIKPGMTADINIIIKKIENALAVPERAVIQKNGKKFVNIRLITGEKEEIFEKEIKTGLKGSDGNIEIIEGLKEGNNVVIFVKEK